MVEPNLLEHLERLPLFPLPRAVLFPGMRMPLHIFEPRYRRMIQDARTHRRPIAIGHLNIAEGQTMGAPPVHPIVGVGVIENLQELPDGRFLLELVGKSRVRILDEHKTSLPYREVRGQMIHDEVAAQPAGKRATQTLRSLIGLLRKREPKVAAALAEVAADHLSPGQIADGIACLVQTDAHLRQAWLEEMDPVARLLAVTDAVSTLVAEAPSSGGVMN